jgi:hypothetical protein
MAAKIIKDYINESMLQIRKTDTKAFEPILQETMEWLLGGNNNKSHEFWKEIALIFRKKYNLSLTQKELLPGFFFNSIMELIPATYDLTKINRRKYIFEEPKIIEPGFVKLLQPKVKCYDRFLPVRLEELRNQARYNKHSKDMCE